jgi:methyltransferase
MVTTERLYLGFIALLAVERGVELVISRRNAARAKARGAVETGAGHFRAMAILHALFLVACPLEVVLLRREPPGAAAWAFLAAALAAQGIRYWVIATLKDRWNVRILVVPGDAPVTAGPYRFLKHPNYTAVILEMLSIPMIHGAFLTALLFSAANALILRIRIRAEEAALGASWATALADRPRLVPGGGR